MSKQSPTAVAGRTGLQSEPPSATAHSRAQSIVEELRGWILSGKYQAGERLPSERELSARMGANRASVREGLKQLEHLGIVRIRPGGGARVMPLEETGLGVLQHMLADGPTPELLSQWLDVWELVIGGAARLAVERASPEELAEAHQLIDQLANPKTSAATFVNTVDALTDLVAVASRNLVLRMVRNGLTAQLDGQRALRTELRPSKALVKRFVAKLRPALVKRDGAAVAEALQTAMREHRPLVLELVSKRQGARRHA